MKLIKFPEVQNLIEAFQANSIKFAFCNQKGDDYAMLFPFVQCREYFNEFLMKNHHPEDFEFKLTFGFNYDYDKYPYDLSKTRLALKFPSQKAVATFLENLPALHKIEDYNGLDKTEIFMADNEKDVLLISASEFWVKKCILTNIYTWILKLCSVGFGTLPFNELLNVRKTNKSQPSECNYLATLGEKFTNALFASLLELAHADCKYVDGTNELRPCSEVHQYSGVIAILNKYSKKLVGFIDVFERLPKAEPTVNFFEKVSV